MEAAPAVGRLNARVHSRKRRRHRPPRRPDTQSPLLNRVITLSSTIPSRMNVLLLPHLSHLTSFLPFESSKLLPGDITKKGILLPSGSGRFSISFVVIAAPLPRTASTSATAMPCLIWSKFAFVAVPEPPQPEASKQRMPRQGAVTRPVVRRGIMSFDLHVWESIRSLGH